MVGGCSAYCGAPYYAAISVLRAGADLSFVFCAPEASQPIKSYSPELIVVPALCNDRAFIEKSLRSVERLHAMVVGPGLGRDADVVTRAFEFTKAGMKHGLGMVLDGDALFTLSTSPDLVKKIHGYKNLILTPNRVEMQRLYASIVNNQSPTQPDSKPTTHSDFSSVQANQGVIVSSMIS